MCVIIIDMKDEKTVWCLTDTRFFFFAVFLSISIDIIFNKLNMKRLRKSNCLESFSLVIISLFSNLVLTAHSDRRAHHIICYLIDALCNLLSIWIFFFRSFLARKKERKKDSEEKWDRRETAEKKMKWRKKKATTLICTLFV